MRTAAPTPAVEITIDGIPLAGPSRVAMASVRVARRMSMPAQCEVAFALPRLGGTAVSELVQRAAIGCRITVEVDSDHGLLFSGDVTAHEWQHDPDGCAEFRLRGYDELHRLRKRQQLIARTSISIADLAAELASEAGLDASVVSGSGATTWPVLVQHAHDDLELLTSLGERIGLYGTVDAGVLHLVDLAGDGESVDLVLHENLVSVRVEATADPSCRSVSITGWDPVSAEMLTGQADEPRSARAVSARSSPEAVGATGKRFIVGHHGPTADHLDSVAQAELDRRVAAESVMTGVAVGDSRLVPGRRVELVGVHDHVAGRYVITESVHTLDGAGYLAQLSTAPPRQRAATSGCDVTVGEVVSADDPQGLGRVRVELPGFGGIETDWREVVSPGAGEGKGLAIVPDMGDRVLVLMPGGDPGASVVLGGLYGGAGPTDAGVVDGAVQRWSMASRGGQRLILDDEGTQVVLANHGGSSVVLGPERLTIHAATDLVIEAPGRTITFRADRLDMQQATSSEDGPPLPPPHPSSDPSGGAQ